MPQSCREVLTEVPANEGFELVALTIEGFPSRRLSGRERDGATDRAPERPATGDSGKGGY